MKSHAERKRIERQNKRDAGLVRREVWILPENAELLKKIEAKLKKRHPRTLNHIDGQDLMHEEIQDCIEYDDFEHGDQLEVDEWLYVGSNKVEVVAEGEYSITYQYIDKG